MIRATQLQSDLRTCLTPTEVGVRVEAEDLVTGERTHTSSAYLVFVALDEHGRPRPVPPLEPEAEVQRRRQAEAKIRRQSRLARAEAIRQTRRGPGALKSEAPASVADDPGEPSGSHPMNRGDR